MARRLSWIGTRVRTGPSSSASHAWSSASVAGMIWRPLVRWRRLAWLPSPSSWVKAMIRWTPPPRMSRCWCLARRAMTRFQAAPRWTFSTAAMAMIRSRAVPEMTVSRVTQAMTCWKANPATTSSRAMMARTFSSVVRIMIALKVVATAIPTFYRMAWTASATSKATLICWSSARQR